MAVLDRHGARSRALTRNSVHRQIRDSLHIRLECAVFVRNHSYKLCAAFVGAIVALALFTPSLASKRKPRTLFRGFSPAHVSAERKLEDKLETIPDPARTESDLRHLTAEPHLAGTEASHRVAEWLRDQYRSFGFDAEIVTYNAWLPQLREIKLELTKPENKTLATPEPPVEVDKDTYDKRALTGFNVYSPSGEVTAPVVYVNYGMRDDYAKLASLGVDVAGKIVI